MSEGDAAERKVSGVGDAASGSSSLSKKPKKAAKPAKRKSAAKMAAELD